MCTNARMTQPLHNRVSTPPVLIVFSLPHVTLGLQSSSIGCDNMSIGSLIVGSFKEGRRRRAVISGGGSLAGSLMGVCENSVILGTLDEEGEDERQ